MAANRRGRRAHDDILTPGEWRVLNWARHGVRRRGIARTLGVSDDAVKYHLANIASKLGVRGIRALRQWPGYPEGHGPGRRSTTMASDAFIGLGSIAQISLFARDIPRTEGFYRDKLGLRHLFTFGQLAFFDCDGIRLYVHGVADREWRPSSILYFRVPDIDAAFEALESRGVEFVGRPHLVHRHASGDEEWMAAFKDPDGNDLELMCIVPPSAATPATPREARTAGG